MPADKRKAEDSPSVPFIINDVRKPGDLMYDDSLMSADRMVPVLLLGVLVLAALVHELGGKKNQTFDGVIVMNVSTYEFYPNAKDCNYRGTPYALLPNARFHEIVNTGSVDVEHIDRLLHGAWRAKLNGNLSPVGWYRYRKAYWRELSVKYVVDAVSISCSDPR